MATATKPPSRHGLKTDQRTKQARHARAFSAALTAQLEQEQGTPPTAAQAALIHRAATLKAKVAAADALGAADDAKYLATGNALVSTLAQLFPRPARDVPQGAQAPAPAATLAGTAPGAAQRSPSDVAVEVAPTRAGRKGKASSAATVEAGPSLAEYLASKAGGQR